ncbi:MAG: magnesium/cobalt transporter CorA [Sphaerochaeta sp.]|uniref:magnesium/cobalt transporter CorA n=1 Tax=Sphaerochaeta sp. TaxID=1972642 RepID=UPI002FCBFD62
MHEKKQSISASHKTKEGMAAGSLLYVGDTQPQKTKINSHIYKEGGYKLQPGLAKAQEGETLWVEISGLEDIREIVRVAKEFSISNLSLEDVFSTDQRLKLDTYDYYLSVTLRILTDLANPEQQLSLFVGKGWVLSIAEYQTDVFSSLVKQLSQEPTKLQAGGAPMLFHSLIDRVVDQYLVKADELELKTEGLEELVITHPEQTDAPSIHRHKADILRIRRMTGPLKDMLSTLIRSENQYLDRNTTFLLRDIYDHALWLSEECEMLRETVSSIMEVYLSSLDMRMNAIMKVLTIISTIFIPLTFLTGVYGMNFAHMPFTGVWWGFYGIMICCIIVVVGMAIYFRRKQWW